MEGDGADAAAVDEAPSAAPSDDGGLAELEQQLYGTDDGASEHDGCLTQEGSAQPMSKRQMKKKAKLERLAQVKLQRRAAEKAAREAEREKRLADQHAQWEAMTEEQRAAYIEQKKATTLARKADAESKREKLMKAVVEGQKIVIDLDFEGKMGENDMRHLCQQLSYSYSANSKVEKPCHLHLLGFKGSIKDLAEKVVSGMDKWFVTKSEEQYFEHFKDQKDKLVYLTADSDAELTDIEPDKIYVIGGLVDHNKYRGLCHSQAVANGIATARLPIQKYVKLETSAVLTVNHVVAVLAEYVNRRDWQAVLDDILPKRKRADHKRKAGEQLTPEQADAATAMPEADAGADAATAMPGADAAL